MYVLLSANYHASGWRATYLHNDHPSAALRTSPFGSVVSITDADAGGTLTPKPDPTDPTISQRYYAYGRERVGKVSDLPTDYVHSATFRAGSSRSRSRSC